MKKKSPKTPDAFVSSDRHGLNGIKLEPWTHDRSIAAQTLGLIYPNLSKEDWASVKRGGIYPGALRDVMLTIWLCTIKKQDVIATEVLGVENAMIESGKFGAKHGIHKVKGQPFWDALSICMAMWNEVNQSVTIPAKAEPETNPEESGNE